MKWIWLTLMVIYCGLNDSASTGIGIDKLSSPTSSARGARTLGFSSEEEDENGIHLHIWNDMSNKNNFYPNLMAHIAGESVRSDPNPASTGSDESNPKSGPTHIHIDLNEFTPTPQPQVSAADLLKNALVHTLALDEFRKSDQNLYGSFYKLKTDRYKPNAINWNYHPSAVNYIPKPYNTNLNGVMPSTPITLPKNSAKTSTARPTLREQMQTTRNFVQDYYTNLHRIKPKSVIESVGYEIGGIPKYSGRLLADEPMPQHYRTFKMFEPVPRQIMLPPLTHRVPDFKPVPPRLKIIPVIDEFLENGNQLVLDNTLKLPWNLIKLDQKARSNYLLPVMPKQLQFNQFKVSEAITMAPYRNFIPKTEHNRIESATETYHHSLLSPNVETLQSIRATQNQEQPPISAATTTTIKATKSINYLPNQYDIQQMKDSISIDEKFPNEHFQPDAKSPILFNKQYSSDYEYQIHQNSEGTIALTKPVPLENFRSNFTDFTQNTSNQQINNIDMVHAAKKSVYKKTKTIRKPQQPSTDEKPIKAITNLNVTGFHKTNDDECNNKTQNNTIHTEIKIKNGDRVYASRLEPSSYDRRRNVLIADPIQLSQTYSRQTTNVPQHKPTSSPLLLMPTTKKNEQDASILQQLANDVKKALLSSLGNDTNPNDHDPFLIVVPENTNVSSDLQFAETATKNSKPIESGRNSSSSIQRMDQIWTIDRKDTVVRTIDNDSNQHIESNHKTKAKTKTKAKSESNNFNNTKHIEKAKQKELKLNANNSNSTSSASSSSNSLLNEKYYKWFNEYAEENRKHGRTVISEHFRKVKIEPNINWIILPSENSTQKVHLQQTGQ